ncbi:hypothetical protein DIPPA_34524 [Diplonema papillatum]|nr:hypothetical protein DIPPA_34524 [Diplonema papillatum]
MRPAAKHSCQFSLLPLRMCRLPSQIVVKFKLLLPQHRSQTKKQTGHEMGRQSTLFDMFGVQPTASLRVDDGASPRKKARKSPSSSPGPGAKKTVQTTLDAGQPAVGPVTCPTCGMVYTHGKMSTPPEPSTGELGRNEACLLRMPQAKDRVR